MTPDDFTAEARRTARACGTDWEQLHWEHDRLCFKVLRDLGYGEGVRVMEETTRWYA